jgi:hypothetical protein
MAEAPARIPGMRALIELEWANLKAALADQKALEFAILCEHDAAEQAAHDPRRAPRRRVPADRLLLTAAAAADLLGISVDTLRAMDLPRVRLGPCGRSIRYSRNDLLEIRGTAPCPSGAAPTTATGSSTSESAASAFVRPIPHTSANVRSRPWRDGDGRKSKRKASAAPTVGAPLRLVTG